MGNRTSKNGVTYTYDDANRLTQVGGVPYCHDVNGNLLSVGSSVYYHYDYENRLISWDKGVDCIRYTYDGDGNRVGISVTGSVYKTLEYINDVNAGIPRVLVEKEDTEGINDYLYSGRMFGRIGHEGQIYYHQDGLGSISVITDVYGQPLNFYQYDAFGDPRSVFESVYNSFRFTGEQNDQNGLLYLRARYYDPITGRFLSRDSLFGNTTDSLSLNRYAYCGNNPVVYVDPSGHIKICQWYELGRGLWTSGKDTVNAIINTPGALWELANAIWRGQISFEQLKQLLGEIPGVLIEPFEYVYKLGIGK